MSSIDHLHKRPGPTIANLCTRIEMQRANCIIAGNTNSAREARYVCAAVEQVQQGERNILCVFAECVGSDSARFFRRLCLHRFCTQVSKRDYSSFSENPLGV